jgi:hypothetical protein
MQKMILLSVLVFGVAAFDNVKVHASEETKSVLMNTVYEEIYQRIKGIKPQDVIADSQTSLNRGERGKMIIEKMKQKNREKLAIMRGHDPQKVSKGSDLVNLETKRNKKLLDQIKNKQAEITEKFDLKNLSQAEKIQWQREAKKEMEFVKQKVLNEHKNWKKKHIETLKKWAKEKNKYEQEVDSYKKTLIDIPLVLPVSQKEQTKRVEVKIMKENNIIPAAFFDSARDQKFRPTCSSFAAVRAIEILLAQDMKKVNLSEQYFYWASKPKCRLKKCGNKGSWAGYGFEYSQKQSRPDIPLEKDCRYKGFSQNGNETQIPLNSKCKKGFAKVESYKYLSTLDQVLLSLKKKKPVLASISLTPNFYKNTGLITWKERNLGEGMDSHADGHAVLLVGYIKLPKVLNEGNVCFITANSWGLGWGSGGHACVTEKWLLSQRKSNPFVVLQKVSSL